MKTIMGIDGLLVLYKERPELFGFLYTSTKKSYEKQNIRNGTFYLPENDEEEEELSELCDKYPNKYQDWIEYQTFLDIIEYKLDHHPNATKEDILDALVYYLENDAFLD
ncbi:DUF7716 domain-containing protein [Snodgrassella alvi]|uniref:DUF7716 domain-containing protein n=1 Tax=Snodgrassella alvi TaxID=1196083 RepID=UPI000C1EF685|nr:hypothetical protein [Snodgrassella alvi]PIT39504.1 hypothetical protein BHC53_09535 [Snodgrassella alvi]